VKILKVGVFNSFLVLVLLLASSFRLNVGTLQYYEGTIANHTKIQMSLELEGVQMKGSFIYEESGELMVLVGRIGKSSQSVILDVINDKDVNIAQIQANYYTNELDEIIAIKGGIIDLKTNKRQLLDLQKVAEFVARNGSATQELYE
jgi:hypothetical protein